jgi:DNA-binding NarL/FixJ family response regulator
MDRIVILVVEDHAAVRAALGNLARFAFPGCAVLECADAATGLASAREHSPAIAIVDVSLPDMEGFELLIRLREELPNTSVLMMSQEPASIHAPRAHALGACGFVAKDRLHQDLVPTLAHALALRSPRPAKRCGCGG